MHNTHDLGANFLPANIFDLNHIFSRILSVWVFCHFSIPTTFTPRDFSKSIQSNSGGHSHTADKCNDLPFAKHPVNLTGCPVADLMTAVLMTMLNHCPIQTNPFRAGRIFGMKSKITIYMRVFSSDIGIKCMPVCKNRGTDSKSIKLVSAWIVAHGTVFESKVRGLPLICSTAIHSARSWFVPGFRVAAKEQESN